AAFSNNIYSAQQGPFNNMGVPGAKAITVALPGYGNPANGAGNYNPFFTRMAKNPSTSSMLSDAMLLNPTFFSLFIGNNDVLLYATNGGASDAITPQSLFDASIDTIVNTLTKNAKGVIGNVPDITALPFFTTVPWNGLTLRQGQADTLNSIWVNSSGTPLYNFKADSNAFLIKDPTAPLGQRQIKKGEFILLSVPLNSIKCHNMGTLIPIPNQYVLTATEINAIEAAIAGYNSKILSVAKAKGLAFVDVNAFLNQTKTGFAYDGITFNAAFVTGGSFSLDGIHLTPIGNALLANEFIKAINSNYGSTILQVDVTKYHGVIFP
ncbi:MAG TPA: SGNH/GDSL hydrolase family protein, partial [Bacteroidia bacterium]|nr:SGNH/GDSL hydrolase family protein [Bacteroidia bacterium]